MYMCVLAQTQKLMEILGNRCISVAVGWFLGVVFYCVCLANWILVPFVEGQE